MPAQQVTPVDVKINFTDKKLTGHGGWVSVFHERLFKLLKLDKRLGKAVCLRRRTRGVSDAQTLLSLMDTDKKPRHEGLRGDDTRRRQRPMPHAVQNNTNRSSAIDGRPRRASYRIRQTIRK